MSSNIDNMDTNMLTSGREIYMKCLYALQQQNISDASTPAAPTETTKTNVPYFCPPKYTLHPQQYLYQSNQFHPQSQPLTSYFQPTSAFEPVNLWPHQQQYAMAQYTTTIDHHYSSELSHTKSTLNATENGYFHSGFESNGIYYDSQMSSAAISTAVPKSSSSSGECSEQNWSASLQSENINRFDSVPLMYGQNGSNCSFDTNYHTNSLHFNGSMPSYDVSVQNEREIPLDVKNRTHERIDEQKKKVPRPMNSFMIYAKRHRAQVHQLYPLCDNRTVSKILSDTWYTMDAEKKREYHELALEMRREHFRLYPDFKWKSTSNETDELQRKIYPDREQHRNGDSNGSFSGFQYDDNGDSMSSYTPITPSTEKSLSPIGCGENVKPLDESKPVHLGPTPAQLGLCRNKKRSKANVPTADECNSGNTKDASKSSTDDLAMVSNHPQFKQRFLNLPKFDFSNYRQSSDWDSSPTTPAITYNTTMRKRKSTSQTVADQQQHNQHQPAKRLIGNHFFGPDFNVNHFKDIDEASSTTASPNSSLPSTPNTPNSTDHIKYAKKVQDSKKRHMLHQRQSSIMGLFQKCGFFPTTQDIDDFLKEHIQLFGTKSFLNVKIREYRQKYMQNHSP